jgi:ankyrin repeat protein
MDEENQDNDYDVIIQTNDGQQIISPMSFLKHYFDFFGVADFHNTQANLHQGRSFVRETTFTADVSEEAIVYLFDGLNDGFVESRSLSLFAEIIDVTHIWMLSHVSFIAMIEANENHLCHVGEDTIQKIIETPESIKVFEEHNTLWKCATVANYKCLELIAPFLVNSSPLILELAEKGIFDKSIKILVEAGFDINERNPEDGKTPLILAAKTGNIKAVEFLLEMKADPNLQDDDEGSPLNHAIKNIDDKLVELLIDITDPHLTDNSNQTSFEHAILRGNVNIIDIFFKRNIPYDEDLIIKTFIETNNPEVLKYFLSKFGYEHTYKYLQIAINSGSEISIIYFIKLINDKASVFEIIDVQKIIKQRYLKVIDYFVKENFLDPNVVVCLAIKYDRLEIIKMLNKHGYNYDIDAAFAECSKYESPREDRFRFKNYFNHKKRQ